MVSDRGVRLLHAQALTRAGSNLWRQRDQAFPRNAAAHSVGLHQRPQDMLGGCRLRGDISFVAAIRRRRMSAARSIPKGMLGDVQREVGIALRNKGPDYGDGLDYLSLIGKPALIRRHLP